MGPSTQQIPRRVLGLFDATSIVIGAIIGVGIFFSPGKVAALCETPGLALGAWGFAGFLALCGGLAFAELGRRFNASGAQYTVIREAFGSFPGFLFVFCNATAVQAGAIGVIASICASNLQVAVGFHLDATGARILSCGLIVIVTLANILGVRWGSRIQEVSVISKLAALVAIIGLALWLRGSGYVSASSGKPPPHALPGLLGPIAALVPAFFAYGGWQHALWVAGEVKDPRRVLPRAILFGVLIVVAVYVLVNWAYLSLLGQTKVATSSALAAEAMRVGFGSNAGRVIAAAVAISAFGVLNAQLLSGPRLIYQLACDGRFFSSFARLSPTRGTPVRAIVLLGIFGAAILAIVGADDANTLTDGVVFLDGIFFALTAASLLIPGFVRRTSTEPPLPWSRLAAGIFFVGELGVVTGAYLDAQTRHAAWIGVVWIILAAVLYAVRFRRAEQIAMDN